MNGRIILNFILYPISFDCSIAWYFMLDALHLFVDSWMFQMIVCTSSHKVKYRKKQTVIEDVDNVTCNNANK